MSCEFISTALRVTDNVQRSKIGQIMNNAFTCWCEDLELLVSNEEGISLPSQCNLLFDLLATLGFSNAVINQDL